MLIPMARSEMNSYLSICCFGKWRVAGGNVSKT